MPILVYERASITAQAGGGILYRAASFGSVVTLCDGFRRG